MIKSLIKVISVLTVIIFTSTLVFCNYIPSQLYSKTNFKLKKPVYLFDEDQTLEKQETGLRRFEIIFLTTLPLTLFITFTGMQIYQMQRQKTTSPTMEKDDLELVFTVSVSASTLIAVKDLIKWKKSQKENEKEKQKK